MFWKKSSFTFVFQLDSITIQSIEGIKLREEILKKIEKEYKIKFTDFFVDTNSLKTTFILSELELENPYLAPVIYKTFAFSKTSDKNIFNSSIFKINNVEILKIKTNVK